MQVISPIKTTSFISASKRLYELTKIRSASITLLKYKKDRLKLEKKFQTIKDKFENRKKILSKENKQETRRGISSNKKSSKLAQKGTDLVSFGIVNLLFTFIKLKALMWFGDPKNLSKIQDIVKGLSGIFKFLDWFTTGSVNNLLNGMHSLLFGGSALERIFGLFSAIVGFFGIRYLLNPLKIIKDLKFIIKNGDKFGQIINSFKESGITKGAADLAQKLTKTTDIFRRGLSKSLARAILKVFGKDGLKFLAKAAAPAIGGITKLVGAPLKAIAKKTVAGIPIVGPLLNLGINLLLGDPLDKALVKVVGSTLGMGLGGIVGSVFPGPGTIIGGALGGIVGDWAASTLYDLLKNAFSKKEEPKLATGGIVTKPTRALIGEAGPEAVIPLPRIYDGTILNAPMGIVASSMIGGIDAVISSLGPIGLTIRPYASSLLSPYRREFGSSNYVFTSDIGGTTGVFNIDQKKQSSNTELEKILGTSKTLNIIAKKESSEESKKARYNSGNSIREILADILNNIINLDFTKKSKNKRRPGDPDPTGDIGDLTGEVDLSSADDRTLLKQLALAEAAGEGVVGMALVVNSVLNRKRVLDGGASTTLYHATDKTIRGIIYSKQSVQYTPVSSGTINKQWGKGSLDLAEKALEMGMDKAKLKTALESEGIDANTVKILLNATGFRNYAAAGIDTSQQVNEVNYKRHTFNTAGVAKMQTGGVVATQGVPDTGPGYTIQGASDEKGRPVVFSQPAASAFAKMMKDSGGVVKAIDVASSKRSIAKNTSAGGATRSTHLYGIGMDIHGSSKEWIKKNGSKYGWNWAPYGGPRDHGGHFEFGGKGIQPSDVSPSKETPISESTPDQQPVFDPIKVSESLGKLYQMLNAPIKFNGAQMEKDSMEYLQAAKDVTAYSDTYIMMSGTNTITNTNLITPVEFPDYSAGSYSSIDSSLAFNLKTRL